MFIGVCVCVCDKGKERECMSTKWFAEAMYSKTISELPYKGISAILTRQLIIVILTSGHDQKCS